MGVNSENDPAEIIGCSETNGSPMIDNPRYARRGPGLYFFNDSPTLLQEKRVSNALV